MNPRIILNTLGLLTILLGTLMLVPGVVAATYREPLGVVAFAFSSLIAISAGIFMSHFGIKGEMSHKEAFATVSLSWLLAAALGSMPYLFLGFGLVDAIFESMSGFTTAGATLLTQYNSQGYWVLDSDLVNASIAHSFIERVSSHLQNYVHEGVLTFDFGISLDIGGLLATKGTYFGLLFWRSFTQLLGGLGIILLFIAILPNLGVAGRELYSVEGIGLTKEAFTPRVRDTAKTFWGIYLGMVALEALLLRAADLPLYDAICTAFSSMATGGFSPKAYSIASYNSVFVEAIVCIFLLLGGTNFIIYYQIILKRDLTKLINDAEFRFYLFIMTVSVLILMVWGRIPGGFSAELRSAVFQVVSTMTTTGFVNNFNYDAWSLAAKFSLILLMIIGGCTGSTGGGIKVGRILIVLKYTYNELIRILHPKAVMTMRMGDRVVGESIAKSVLLFVQLYLLVLFCASLAFAITESGNPQFNAISAISAAASCLGVVGPGFGIVALDFSGVSVYGRILGLSCMYIGRLEILPVILLFLPETWRR
jgi:trk system potassium uptake protein TrkH